MVEHFLKDFVVGIEREQPRPWYNPDGDCIVFQVTDDAVIAQRVDEVLTIYLSAVTRKAIGYQLKGVAAITKKCGFEGMQVQCRHDGSEIQQVSITGLLLAAYEDGPKTGTRRMSYAEVMDQFSGHSRMDANSLGMLIPTLKVGRIAAPC